jgi:hypothetical protein
MVDLSLAHSGALWAFPLLRIVGVLLIIAAIPVLLDSFVRFAL